MQERGGLAPDRNPVHEDPRLALVHAKRCMAGLADRDRHERDIRGITRRGPGRNAEVSSSSPADARLALGEPILRVVVLEIGHALG
ncbi:MAG: hypothetical protein AMXMBFR55_32680 [Gemmatimonadota bacterium]